MPILQLDQREDGRCGPTGRSAPAGLWRAFALALILFGALHLVGSTRAEAADGSRLPCDRYAVKLASDGSVGPTPCLAAHSTVRLLFSSYLPTTANAKRRLYQVQRASDNKTQDIGLLSSGDYADAPAQDAFCAGTQCIITMLYDQSGHNNDLEITKRIKDVPKGSPPNTTPEQVDHGVPAEGLPVTAGGHQVYGMSFSNRAGPPKDMPAPDGLSYGMGYHSPYGKVDVVHDTNASVQAEGMYMVASGTHSATHRNSQDCCFEYGNGETNVADDHAGSLDAVYLGLACQFPLIGQCSGSGPWVEADLENGLFGSSAGPTPEGYTGDPEPYVTVMLKNDGTTTFTLKSGDAQKGTLTQRSSGPEPTHNFLVDADNPSTYQKTDRYTKYKQGAIVLGTGGDNSHATPGSFFEGVITQGYPSDSAEADVQANIASVGYGKPTGKTGSLTPSSEISLEVSIPQNSMKYLQTAPAGSPTTVAAKTNNPSATTWIVRRGLANSTNTKCLSYEAKDFPGAFLRNIDGVLYADYYDGQESTRQDETFCTVSPGRSGISGTTSFQVQTPGSTDRYVGMSKGERLSWLSSVTWCSEGRLRSSAASRRALSRPRCRGVRS